MDNIKATNTGFGISYVLPIIVATLVAASSKNMKAKPLCDKSLIIIENPEAHVHPGAQAKLMELICLAAKVGVQFIIETHSDHIVNSLLVAVKQKIISPEQSKIYYFDRDESIHSTKPINLEVLKDGRLKNPPPGFFDQIDIHMKALMGF
jgi:predicted ATPase